MTTIPARSLSGDHLGRVVTIRGVVTLGGALLSVDHDIHRGVWICVSPAGLPADHMRRINPDTPVTIEDTE